MIMVYNNNIRVLDDSLSIGECEIFAMFSLNGAGKITLMRMLSAQISPTSSLAYVMDY